MLYSTGHQDVDDIIRGIIDAFESAFPGRVVSYYLVGSHADGNTVALSDIDIRVVFEGDFLSSLEVERVIVVRQSCRSRSPVAIDLPLLSEARLRNDEDWLHEAIGIRTGGILLDGKDITDSLPLASLDAYLRNYTYAPVLFFARLRGRAPHLNYPLDYPDPAGEFCGYDEIEGRHSTQNFVLALGYAATCLIAWSAGQMVTRKTDWPTLYRAYVDDEWASLLDEIYGKCRLEWEYRIPDALAERRTLRELCRGALAFENHYLAHYRAYLLTELRKPGAGHQLFAVKRFRDVVYPDQEVATALEAVQTGDSGVQRALEKTLEVYKAGRRRPWST